MATTQDYDALLTALALIEAYAERDEDTIDGLMNERDPRETAAVVSNLLEVQVRTLRLLAMVTQADPLMPIDDLRHRTLRQMAAKGMQP